MTVLLEILAIAVLALLTASHVAMSKPAALSQDITLIGEIQQECGWKPGLERSRC
jgi:hypothetical protein